MSNKMRLIFAYFLAELIGTFLLVVIGDGAIAAYVMTRRQVDPFCACFAFGVGAMIATFASAKISGAHINPAASFAFALDGRLSWCLLPVYLVGQYLGGFLAASVLYLNYYEAIKSIDSGEHTAFNSTTATGQVFATYPANYVTIWTALMDQIIGTGILLFSLSAVCDRKNVSLELKHQPLVIAFVIGIICVAFSPNCGAIFNPARDLTPRLLTFFVGYESVWAPLGGQYWFVAGVLGPHLGAILGVFGYKLLIGSSLELIAVDCNDLPTAINDQSYSMDVNVDANDNNVNKMMQKSSNRQTATTNLTRDDSTTTLPMNSMVQRRLAAANNNNNNNNNNRTVPFARAQQNDVDYGSTN